MRLILEMDGPIVDPEPRYWSAYNLAAAESGCPRLSRAEFWRRLRIGDAAGRWLPGTTPARLEKFRKRFEALLEDDASFADQTPAPGIKPALERLRRHAELALVTAGANRQARQSLLERLDLAVHFMRMLGLAVEPHRRGKQLADLVEIEGRTLVAASSLAVLQAAHEAGLPRIGIGNGAVTGKRLVQGGAALTIADLAGLAEEIEAGGTKLLSAGVMPTEFPTVIHPFAGSRPLPRRTF